MWGLRCLYDLIGGVAALFIIHCLLPVFLFLLVYSVGLRDFSRLFDLRNFAAN